MAELDKANKVEINEINNEVLAVTEFKNGRIEKTHLCPKNRIRLETQVTSVNMSIDIPIIYEVYSVEEQKYVVDALVNKEVIVDLDGLYAGTETILSGIGNIEFESDSIGTYKITVEDVSCEVIVK